VSTLPEGKAITVRGPVEPDALGRALMHEHLHSDVYDWEHETFISEERPTTEERRDYLLREAVPHLKACREHGCHAYVDTTPAPWRGWPTTYVEVAEAADVHIVLCTGSYREMEVGTYWVKRAHHPGEETVACAPHSRCLTSATCAFSTVA